VTQTITMMLSQLAVEVTVRTRTVEAHSKVTEHPELVQRLSAEVSALARQTNQQLEQLPLKPTTLAEGCGR